MKLTLEQEKYILAKEFVREFTIKPFKYQVDEEIYLENSLLSYLERWRKLCQTHQI